MTADAREPSNGVPGADAAAELEFVEGWAEAFANAYIEAGDLDPTGKSRKEVLLEAARLWLANPTDLDAGVRFDHEERLLSEARRYGQNPSDADFALMMYATWFEHRLNVLLHVGASARGMGEAEFGALIRKMNMPDKTGAKFADVFGAELALVTARKIRQIAERRNEFVHYKWPIATAPSWEASAELIVTAEEAVLELDRFYRSHVLRGFGLDVPD